MTHHLHTKSNLKYINNNLLLTGPLGPLFGTPNLQGSKNASLPIIVAAALVPGTVTLRNIPNISDTKILVKIIQSLGIDVRWLDTNTLVFRCSEPKKYWISDALSSQLRASLYTILIPIRFFGRCIIGRIGGDKIPGRSIALQIHALEEFGLVCKNNNRRLKIFGEDISPAFFSLRDEGISASCISIMLASIANGTSKIQNISNEPEVYVLIDFLRSAGLSINVENATVVISGCIKECDIEFTIPDDRLVLGTWAIATAIIGGEILFGSSWATEYSLPLINVLTDAGVDVSFSNNNLIIKKVKRTTGMHVKTGMYPQFPTDLLPQLISLMSLSNGKSIAEEKIYKQRFGHIPQLKKMGADICLMSPNSIEVRGVKYLSGCKVNCIGIREAAALFLGGGAAIGTTYLQNFHHFYRGYEIGFLKNIEDLNK